ncbi:GNAT family N-acetyltransferase [Fluoribacter gormanii]|uniref:Protein N-acetyltransferase, RimJ/RimL family n=1 Tax=Fluoribacter gormanii TaxID=464 RepID=A0A377GJQ0_9GAMM|nr:GNAT family N-acetyltransferase [Fluoribacter gormanii]KTD00928.1 acetyltransferase [Fluoribacter gormanii]MCW8443416.1 GNAT family N-acetyltransferase [Fluoribacter gormanii]MCW8471844.1 GNAT family N-acetyltransferase [Fluoribacter gormanii]SIQ82195.1 Protein N-acetyltransferase, RimJ/RimL family [Fluoribacter gormanii]STO25046.1 ribosomal-protein-S5-alanine N-acetyltransferase [Fluoribacter gormanii]
MNTLETPRLLLRAWSDDDIAPFFSMNQDPKVMEYIANFWTMDMVTSFIARMNAQLAEKSYTLWAVEEKSTHQFMGFIGLNSPVWEAHFTPCVEIGWRLASSFWGKGYATEGAQAVLNYAFKTLKLKEVVAFTVPDNLRSQRVMEKLGMIRDRNGDFLHPKIDPVNYLAKHYLFRIRNNPD